MKTDTAYAELGLAPGASEREVKAAWRRLVSRWHPDRNASAHAVRRMQRINQALEAIRRAGFAEDDGAAPPDAPDEPPARPAPDEAPAAGAASGAGRRPRAEARGQDSDGAGPEAPRAEARTESADPEQEGDAPGPGRVLLRKLKLTLEEAATGCTKSLRGRFTLQCAACSGLGHRVLGGHCAPCGGSGAVRQSGWYGLFGGTATECGACHGSGMAREACSDCGGSGSLGTRAYKLDVRLPHGVRDGDLLHVDARRAGAGDALRGIDLRVELQPHERFQLDDDGTLRCTMPVDGFAWVAQRTIDVPTLTGLHALRLRRDVSCHRLKGEGFPVQRRGPRGDLLVTVVPSFPERFSADQDILLDQLIATAAGAGPARQPRQSRKRKAATRA
ncbi:DnaJ C-terminal domain-containing protein [Ideonella sp. A 288]|uniref:DnaJ C-terminal domain-containing protein n=1 Tax=Ideonella sp. A 288 TaxID=1962181 RepID=UPI000B4A9633|nr:DnaJ C-terminal domain-containing protein [Ideonella sp. A 288]